MKITYSTDKQKQKENIKSVALIVGLLIIVAILIGWISGINKDKSSDSTTRETFTNTTAVTTASTTGAYATIPSTQGNTTTKEGETTTKGDTVTKAPETTTAFVGTPKNMSTAEIVDLFNKGINSIKTDAVKVVRNYTKSAVREEYVEMPLFRDMFLDSLKESFADDMVPIEMNTKEDIIARYPVADNPVASVLTVNEVESAKCVENDDAYEVTVVLHPDSNPTVGKGIGTVFTAMTNDDVMEGAPKMIKEFSGSYVDCSVKCIIDKKTGRATHSTYYYTVITTIVVDLTVMETTARVGIGFEDDFSITY